MKFELIVSVPVCNFTLKSWRKIDDVNCFERAFFDTKTTSNTQNFRNESNLWSFVDFNTFFSSLDNRTMFIAFEWAFLGFAFLSIHNSYSCALLFFWVFNFSFCLLISSLLLFILFHNFFFVSKIWLLYLWLFRSIPFLCLLIVFSKNVTIIIISSWINYSKLLILLLIRGYFWFLIKSKLWLRSDLLYYFLNGLLLYEFIRSNCSKIFLIRLIKKHILTILNFEIWITLLIIIRG